MLIGRAGAALIHDIFDMKIALHKIYSTYHTISALSFMFILMSRAISAETDRRTAHDVFSLFVYNSFRASFTNNN